MRFTRLLFSLCLSVAAVFTAAGQPIVKPSLTAEQVCNSSDRATTINCDMIVTEGYDRLFTIAWDDVDGQAFFKVFHRSEVEQSQLVTLPQGASQPDIAVANDMAVSGNYKVAVAYQLQSDVYLGIYTVSGASSGMLQVTETSTTKLNTQPAANPHIDMFADAVKKTDGKPSLHKFGIVWEEYDPSVNELSVQGRVADVASPTTYTWNVYVPQATGADIAGYVDATTHKEYLCVLYTKNSSIGGTGSDLRVLETELDGSLNLFHFLEKGKEIASARIEAHAFYKSGASKWAAVAATAGSANDNYTLKLYNDSKTGADISTPLGNTYNNNCPAIAAGAGNDNEQYATAFFPMYDSSLYLTSDNQWNGSWDMPYEEVNHTAMNISSGMPAVAVSSASNTGLGHLIAWFNGHDVVYRIMNDEMRSANPTGIGNTFTDTGINIYPNPASNVLHIAGSKATAYTVTDITGRNLLSGNFGTEHTSANTASLFTGIYILHLHSAEGDAQIRFVKE